QPRRRLLDVGGEGWEGFAQNRAWAKAEDKAEESRLLYVALTRAQHHLIVWWVENHAAIDQAKLTDLLTRDGQTPVGLAAASGGTIELATMTELAPVDHYRPLRQETTRLELARFDRGTDQAWRRVSFSSLSADQPLTSIEEHTEHGLRTDEGEPLEEEPPVAAPEAALPLADLPAGARFGTLVHDVLETLRFDAADLEAVLLDMLEERMRTSGWDFEPHALVAGLEAMVKTPLGPGPDDPRLVDLEGPRLARELIFELPVRNDSPPITLADIGRVMDRHLADDDLYRPYLEEMIDTPGMPFRGFMSGAIDVVAVLPGERYVVMDYKSNALTKRGRLAGPRDYGPAALAAEMVSHRYVLQATLYQVALHRYLQWRLPGYDPAERLGGAMYLFVRGMLGPDTPLIDGERCGVARWRPPAEMIVELSDLFSGPVG
ncbi:MAG TPA: PD-(D/E)XK nuclease family protein, partial [Acidimicrobiia bacterium]|nr:PD-(D/E)XK nuclease family protein [Acidimicrobiia bacterium]